MAIILIKSEKSEILSIPFMLIKVKCIYDEREIFQEAAIHW